MKATKKQLVQIKRLTVERIEKDNFIKKLVNDVLKTDDKEKIKKTLLLFS